MKLYIFEPYEWVYCGGAIGVIAETFDKAVEIIIVDDKTQAEQRVQKQDKLSANDYRTYRSKYFQRNPDTFKKNHYDQWLLTNKIQLIDSEQPRTLFDNWNYA